MRADAVGLALDQRRPAAGSRLVDRFLHREIDGNRVVAVQLHAGKSVRLGLDRDRLAGGLLRGGDADRPVVVLADEDDRRLEHAGEVHRHVEVALAGRAVAQVGRDHGPIALDPRRHGRADRLRQLRPDAGRPRNLIDRLRRHVRRHLAALGLVARVAEDLAEVRHQRKAAQQHRAAFAQRREDPVARLQRDGGSQRGGLLSGGGAVETDSTLPLQRHHPLVECAQAHHLAIEAQERLARNGRFVEFLGGLHARGCSGSRQRRQRCRIADVHCLR